VSNLRTQVERLSAWYDAHRPDVQRIVVRVRRGTLLRHFPARWRGGPIVYRGRELVSRDPVPRPEKTDNATVDEK